MKASVEASLKSTSFQRWLAEPVFVLEDVSVSRERLAHLTDSPCTRAAQNLTRILSQMQISSLKQVHAIGLDGLTRCKGLGERAAWVAACVLDHEGYDVEAWLDRKPRKVVTWKGAVVHSVKRAAKRKHA